MRKRFGRNDIILIAVVLIAAGVMLFAWKYFISEDGAKVQVTVDGVIYGTYPLDKDATVDIKDSDGNVTNTLIIKDKKADMTSAFLFCSSVTYQPLLRLCIILRSRSIFYNFKFYFLWKRISIYALISSIQPSKPSLELSRHKS